MHRSKDYVHKANHQSPVRMAKILSKPKEMKKRVLVSSIKH